MAIYRNETERNRWRAFANNLPHDRNDPDTDVVRDLFLVCIRQENVHVDDAIKALSKKYRMRNNLIGGM